MKNIFQLSILFFLLSILISCALDPIGSGDGKYSYYTAEMATFTPDNDTLIHTGQLDDNRTIQLNKKVRVEWAEPAKDCRMMLYFNKISDTQTDVQASPLGAVQCYMPKLQLADTLKKTPATDPVVLNAAWTSKNGKYCNIHFAIKTGTADKNITQTIGLVCDSIRQNCVHAHFIHDQNSAPEFYSVEGFISIPKTELQRLAENENPTLKLTINTYNGPKTIDYNQQNTTQP